MKFQKTLFTLTILIFQLTSCASSENQSEEKHSEKEQIKNRTKQPEKRMSKSEQTTMNQNKESIFDGIYVNNSTTPRIYIIKNGQFALYRRKYDENLPTKYYYDKEELNEFTVLDGNFKCNGYNLSFQEENGLINSFSDTYNKNIKINSIKRIFEINEWDARPLLNDLMANHQLNQEEAKELIIREDLFEHFKMNFNKKLKFNMRELALNYLDNNLSKIEDVADNNAYNGVYGFKNDSRLDKFLFIQDGEFKWYRLTTDAGNEPHELQFKYVSITSSKGPVAIKDGQYSYNRDREYGHFIVEGGKVTSVKSGTTTLIKMETLGDLVKNNSGNIDAKTLLASLDTNYGIPAEKGKKIILEAPLSKYFNPSQSEKFQIIDIIKAAAKDY